MSRWSPKVSERGDVDAFSFPLRRPSNRKDINEDSCPICLNTRPSPKSWVAFGVCNHATCYSCFKQLVRQQGLHAACPLCRSLLAVGDGDRGAQRYKRRNQALPGEEQRPATQPTAGTAAGTAADQA